MMEIGPREYLLQELRTAQPTEAERSRPTLDQLVARCFFEHYVRSVARNLLEAFEDEEEALVRELDLSDCPGSWLQRKVELRVRRASSEPEPSHHFDAERLSYLPYVDLLLTDAEMAEFVRQIMRDESTTKRIRTLRPPLAISDTLEALEQAVFSLDV